MSSDEGKTSEVELLDAVLAGDDRQAWPRFRMRFNRLITLCVHKVLRRYQAQRRAEDVEDIVSDVWLQLLADDCRRLRHFDATRGLSLGTWLGQIATNATIDQLRKRRREHYLEDLAERETLAVAHATPHDLLEQRQTFVLARCAIEHLTDHERRFLYACYRDDRAPRDLAVELGVSVNAIYNRRFKVRAKLTRLVTQLGLDVPANIAA